MRYFAHSGRQPDKGDWQLLADHLHAVAELAAKMAASFGLEKAAFLAGLFHDLGKYTAAFQKRLDGGPSPDHATAGAVILPERVAGQDRMIADLIAYCIAGHHAGLPDRLNETPACLDRRIERFRGEPSGLEPIWESELTADMTGLVPGFMSRIRPPNAAFQFSVMVRMIFSCLVDADFKDTEAFYHALDGRAADRDWPALQDLLPQFIAAFDTHMAGKGNADTDLNRLRGKILSHVRTKAADRPGLFTLTVPTGGGKTLSSLAFALDHAKAHGHSRIIYAIPFTSIIDQTAEIFRNILGEDKVLEHHSAIDDKKLDNEKNWESRDKLKLATEDWAAPVVVTTNVQLFESLFAARTSKARKVHSIANSIIILDEAQTIPRDLLIPCARMLDELALNYGCTIVLCTATQPALDKRNFTGDHPAGLMLEGRELAPDPKGLSDKLRRAYIRLTGAMSNDDLIAALAAEPQALVIVNSRKHALELYRQAKSADLSGLIHLTTRQYAVHRQDILKDVRERLKAGKPCRVIATSLIEAGVDVDFPKAWRAEAGLDQIIQAAGRVNREGKRLIEESIVTVFSAPDYLPPSEIRGLIGDMERMRAKGIELQSLDAIEDYFGEVYWRAGKGGLDRKKIIDDFRLGRGGTDFAFRRVAEKFHMIESSMEPVIIIGDEVAQQAVDKLSIEEIPSGAIARKLQTYIVQVPPKARELLIRNGHVAFARPDLRGDQFAVLQNRSLYDREVGLLWENAEYLAAENSVI
ncbi:CRISPR-associated helicase Cas3' [Rhizobium terrae]|uniref:CRISPR-associated helicase Cas3' n=1 Tax=Rhizobium terrae TaxID=2171756 RepID=UPI000E3DEFC4|nr:CRISPR-associated helicase Cas3' [Rhizobium terrae]